jgi:hypothetical protein
MMSVDFPGGNGDDIDVGNGSSLQITGPFSVSCWANFDALQNKDIVSKQTSSNRGFSLQTDDWDPDTYIHMVIAVTSSQTKSSGWALNPVTYGKWHHLVGVFIPSTAIQIWQDVTKKEKTVDIPASMHDPSNNVIIGGRPDNIGNVNGKIDDVRIYNKSLSPAEIQTIYAANGHDGIIDGLVSRWLMNEKSPGTTVSGTNSVKDIGPSGNHGTPGTANCSYAESVLSFRRAA